VEVGSSEQMKDIPEMGTAFTQGAGGVNW